MTQTAKVFQSGNSQAVRLPKAFRLNCSSVEIFRQGNDLILRPRADQASALFDALVALKGQISPEREQGFEQDRENLI